MTNRITERDLAGLAETLNRVHPGHDYSIAYAYGGCKLEADGGSRAVSTDGFDTKRKLYVWMHAYLDGIWAERNRRDAAIATLTDRDKESIDALDDHVTVGRESTMTCTRCKNSRREISDGTPCKKCRKSERND
jgi:hypothetical protein